MLKKLGMALVAGASLVAGSAMAAIDATVATAITTELAAVQANAGELSGYVWPIVIAIFGLVVLFKLFKRFAGQV
jgi:hypothetical protein